MVAFLLHDAVAVVDGGSVVAADGECYGISVGGVISVG